MATNLNSYIFELLQKLIQKTKSNEVKWTKTSRSNQYMLKIDSGAFMIELNGFIYSSTPSVRFKILNEIGDEIQLIEQSNSIFKSPLTDISRVINGVGFDDTIQKKLDELLQQLYDAADANSNGIISSSLRKMIEELDNFTQSPVR